MKLFHIIKRAIKSALPRPLLQAYHWLLAYSAAWWYGHPSRRMVVVGVIGTRGKTTTANYIWSVLTHGGFKTGLTGTANIRIGNREEMNTVHMTMPGRFALQRLLYDMRRAGCTHVIIETPSEGIEQYRHVAIAYDILVLTRLYPEYSEAHGWSAERCMEMNLVPFRELAWMPRKIVGGQKVPKAMVVDIQNDNAPRFLEFVADKKLTYGTKDSADLPVYVAHMDPKSVHFTVRDETYELHIPGAFNAVNAAAAIGVGRVLNIGTREIKRGLEALTSIPGRMESIDAGQSFSVFVDYAHDAVSLDEALKTVRGFSKEGSVIVLFGGQGGGRDKKKLPEMGRVAAEKADYVILSNDDPFDDEPMSIIDPIAEGAKKHGKTEGKNLFLIPDRREGIRKAFALAKKGDIVFLAGKGADQLMYVKHGKKLPWDDRVVAREEIKKIIK